MVETYKGLRGQIRYVEETIAIKKQMRKDASFEKELVREWRNYLPGGSKYNLWLSHSYAARHQEKLAVAPPDTL